jgi:hypothetical protein
MTTMPTTTTTTTIRHYDWIPEWLGAPTSLAEREQADARAQAYLDEHEGDDLCIVVRRPRRGEAAGLYAREIQNGRLQIFGYALEIPAALLDLLDRAYDHALATWPASPPADPATIRAVAEAMVAADRGRDCDPDVRDDYEADDGSDWEHDAIGELAAGIDRTIEDGEAWATTHREAVLDAYRAAWCKAVEADRVKRRFWRGQRVVTTGLTDEDSDSGHVVRYLSDTAVLVAWDGGVVTPCPVEYLVEE